MYSCHHLKGIFFIKDRVISTFSIVINDYLFNHKFKLFFFNAFSSHANMHRLYSHVFQAQEMKQLNYLYNKRFVQTVCFKSDFHASRIQLPRPLLQMKDFLRKKASFFHEGCHIED